MKLGDVVKSNGLNGLNGMIVSIDDNYCCIKRSNNIYNWLDSKDCTLVKKSELAFNAGDKVKCVDNNRIGTIIEINVESKIVTYWVKFGIDGFNLCYEHQLEKV